MNNFEPTFLYQLNQRSAGVPGIMIPMSSEVMNSVDKQYAPKIQGSAAKGLVGVDESYQAGVFCKKYWLTDQGCKVASKIKYGSIKDSNALWKKQVDVWIKNGPFKFKTRLPTGEEEKSVSLKSERNGLNDLFRNPALYDNLRKEIKLIKEGKKVVSDDYKEKLNGLLAKEKEYKNNDIRILIDNNGRRYTPLSLASKELRALFPKFYEVDFKSSNYQMLVLELINNKSLSSHLKGEAREALRLELKDLFRLCQADFYKAMGKDMAELFEGAWTFSEIERRCTRERIKHSSLVFLGIENNDCFKNEKLGFSSVQIFSTVFQKRFPKIHQIILNVKEFDHCKLSNLLMTRESLTKVQVINNLNNLYGSVPSIASIHDCFVTTSKYDYTCLRNILDKMNISYKVSVNNNENKNKSNGDHLLTPGGVEGSDASDNNNNNNKNNGIDELSTSNPSDIRKGFPLGYMLPGSTEEHNPEKELTSSVPQREGLPPPPNILKSKQVLSRQSDEVNNTPECEVVSSTRTTTPITPTVSNKRGSNLKEELEDLSWEFINTAQDNNKSGEGLSDDQKKQLELLREMEIEEEKEEQEQQQEQQQQPEIDNNHDKNYKSEVTTPEHKRQLELLRLIEDM